MSFASHLKNLANKARQKVKDAEKENKPLTYEEWRKKFDSEIENAKSHLEEQLTLSAERGEYRTIFHIPYENNHEITFYRVAAKELGCSFVKRPNVFGQYSVSFANAVEELKGEKIIIPPYNEIIRPQDKTYVCPAMNRDSSDKDNEIKPASDWIEKPATLPNKTEHPVF